MTIWTGTMANLHIPFGPILMQDQLSQTTFDILNKKSKQARLKPENDFRSKLAGNLEEEYMLEFDDTEKNIVYNELIGKAQNYITEAKANKRMKKFGRPNKGNLQIVEPVWVNYMKAGEWNPAHYHAGYISCVMYLQVPKEIEEENNSSDHSNKSNQPSAGKIQWTYGETIQFSETFFTQIPKERDIWFFPAELKHFVYPFKSNAERVSISCNFK